MAAKYPAIPEPTTDVHSLQESVKALKQGFEILSGQKGPATAAAVTPDALNTKAAVSSPTFGGVPKAPTAAPGTSSKQLATTEFVSAAVAAGALPTIDNTLKANGKQLYYDATANSMKWCWASPIDRTADIRDFMDAQYGVGLWSTRSTAHTGTDAVPAIHAALDALRSRYSYGTLKMGVNGILRCASGLDSTKLKGMMLEGERQESAQIVFDFASGVAFPFTGAGGYSGGGLRNLTVYMEDGYPTGTVYGILVSGDATDQADGIILEHLRMTSLNAAGSFWYQCLNADGTARTAPQGIRVATLNDVQLFCARNIGAYFANCVQWDVNNFGVYVGSGGGNDVYITGNGTSQTNTTQMDFRRFSISGDLYLNNCQKVSLNGTAVNVRTNSTATYIDGFVEGTVVGTVGAHSSLTQL